MSRLHSTRGDFGEQNPPLQLLLGLLSATERLTQLLPSPQADTAEASAAPDPIVAALLGVVAFRSRLLAVLEPARTECHPRETSAPAAETLRDLLR